MITQEQVINYYQIAEDNETKIWINLHYKATAKCEAELERISNRLMSHIQCIDDSEYYDLVNKIIAGRILSPVEGVVINANYDMWVRQLKDFVACKYLTQERMDEVIALNTPDSDNTSNS